MLGYLYPFDKEILMLGFGRKKESVVAAPAEEIIRVDISVMDERFDRSAGRFCDHCGISGSHHTDTHNDFARAALKRKELHY
jgi:hypothetical protein